mgnify:CR=1 FL=1
MENQKIRDRARIENVRYWQIARELGITAGTLTVWLRSEMPEDKRQRVDAAIDAIVQRRAES